MSQQTVLAHLKQMIVKLARVDLEGEETIANLTKKLSISQGYTCLPRASSGSLPSPSLERNPLDTIANLTMNCQSGGDQVNLVMLSIY